MNCLSRQYHFKFFEGSLSQILFDPCLNKLPQMVLRFSLRFSFLQISQENTAKPSALQFI